MNLLQDLLAIAAKDMKQMRNVLLFGSGLLLVYGVILPLLPESGKGLIVLDMVMAVSIVGLAARSTMIEDLRWPFLYSLPMAKSHIALGKYAAILAGALFFLLSATLGFVIGTLIVNSTNGIAASIWVLAAVAGISLLFAGTSLAISLRWGVRAAHYLLYLPLLLTLLAEIPGLKQATSPVAEAALTFWQRTNPSPAAVAVAVSVAILAVYLLLAAIAARLLESREV